MEGRRVGISLFRVACIVLVFATLAFALSQTRIRGFSRAYGPVSSLIVARPTVLWEVWGEGAAKVTQVELKVNGQPVAAAYNPNRRRAEFVPPTPLAPGQYRVEGRALIEGRLEMRRDWSFTVRDNAFAALPDPSPAQIEAAKRTNEMRTKLGLGEATLDRRLATACQMHAEYLLRNNRMGHEQDPALPGFFGKTTKDRLDAVGFVGGFFEGEADGDLQLLFDAPYHRIPFLVPGTPEFGTGRSGPRTTIAFGMTEAEALVVSPADGQKGIRLDWTEEEHPNPLRVHGASQPTGYPIVVAYFTPQNERVTVQRATLETSSGESVEVLVNSSANDEFLTNAAFLIPRSPLKPATTYRASVALRTASGKDVERNWSFTTR